MRRVDEEDKEEKRWYYILVLIIILTALTLKQIARSRSTTMFGFIRKVPLLSLLSRISVFYDQARLDSVWYRDSPFNKSFIALDFSL